MSELDPISLTSQRLLLSSLEPTAAPLVLDYLVRNHEFVRVWSPIAPPDFFTLEGQRARLERERQLRAERAQFRLWLFARDDARREHILGDLSLSNIVWGAFRSCHLGYKIDQRAAGQGYMTEAVRTALDFAFDTLGLHRVEANIMPRNARSRRVVEKLGFVNEGISRAYLKINGVWEDHIHYVMLSPHDV